MQTYQGVADIVVVFVVFFVTIWLFAALVCIYRFRNQNNLKCAS